MPDPVATTSQAREFYAGEEASSLQVSVAMGTAARTVAAIVPPPPPDSEGEDSPLLGDWEAAARDAELIVGKFVWNTDSGTLSSAGASGKSVSFTALPAVRELVEGAMAGYSGGAFSATPYPIGRF